MNSYTSYNILILYNMNICNVRKMHFAKLFFSLRNGRDILQKCEKLDVYFYI